MYMHLPIGKELKMFNYFQVALGDPMHLPKTHDRPHFCDLAEEGVEVVGVVGSEEEENERGDMFPLSWKFSAPIAELGTDEVCKSKT